MGAPGTGKSTSLRNLDPVETFIIKPNNKQLPFEGDSVDYKEYDPATGIGNVMFVQDAKDVPSTVRSVAAAPHIKNIVIEDISHWISERIMSKTFVRTTGFDKWSIMGGHINDIMVGLPKEIAREDINLIFITHTDLKPDGTLGFKSSGNSIDKTVVPESHLTYVFHSMALQEGDKITYKFLTKLDGMHRAKTPAGIFTEDYIDNDLDYIILKIRAKEGCSSLSLKGELYFTPNSSSAPI